MPERREPTASSDRRPAGGRFGLSRTQLGWGAAAVGVALFAYIRSRSSSGAASSSIAPSSSSGSIPVADQGLYSGPVGGPSSSNPTGTFGTGGGLTVGPGAVSGSGYPIAVDNFTGPGSVTSWTDPNQQTPSVPASMAGGTSSGQSNPNNYGPGYNTPPSPFNNGAPTLLQPAGYNDVWLVNNGQPYWVPNPDAAKALIASGTVAGDPAAWTNSIRTVDLATFQAYTGGANPTSKK